MNSKPEPTWTQHHQLTSHLWGAIRDGEAYLAASNELFGNRPNVSAMSYIERRALMDKWQEDQKVLELANYHFIVSLGRAMRTLKWAQNVFPSIQPAYSRANHLINEARALRNMIEHADEYFEGMGKQQEDFVREAPDVGVPGDKPGTADASATVINSDGHWLGGRLCVEKALAELKAIQVEADKLPMPSA